MDTFTGTPITYDLMRSGEENDVIEVILSTFNEFVAPGYGDEGVTAFCNYANTKGLKERAHRNHCTLVAKQGQQIIGTMEIRDNNHISLFFVKKGLQKKGVGKGLITLAKKKCFSRNQNLQKVTVNASPNAVGAYKTLGFKAEGPEQCISGIRLVPMSLKLI